MPSKLIERKKELDNYGAFADNKINESRARLKSISDGFYKSAKAFDAIPESAPISTPVLDSTTPSTDPTLKDNTFNTSFWDGRAKEGGFSDSAAVKQWQQNHGSKYGIVADGKFGPRTKAAYEQYKRDLQPLVEESGNNPPSPVVPTTPIISSADALKRASDTFGNENYFRKNKAWGYDTITIDGKTYQMRVTKGLKDGSGLINDESYAFDPATGKVRRVAERWSGAPKNSWAEGEDWIDLNGFADEQEWLQNNPKPANRYLLNNANQYYINPKYNTWETNYANNKRIWYKKQGGTMNKINYFQQGGVAPQQDIRAQVTALVLAAMQGDQKATQTVNQIIEAAKAGDQQATQLAQMIQEIAKQMQGQATRAKWGSKLSYLQSLKCGGKTKKKEKGGKVCPECDKVVKAQLGASLQGAGFYRNWSPEEIRALQNRLYGHGYYKGELDGIIGAQTLDAVRAYQRAHNLKEDGMWGVSTNSQQKMIDNAIINKGIYSKDYQTEKGSLFTPEGMEYWRGKTLDDLSNQQVQELTDYYMVNPELLYSDDPQHAAWRQILHNSGKNGSDFLNMVAGSLTLEERKKIDSKKLTTKYKSDAMVDSINESRNKAARTIVPMLAAAPVAVAGPITALTGGAPIIGASSLASGTIGAYLGNKSGKKVGRKVGEKNKDKTYNDPVAERYGATAVTHDPSRRIKEAEEAGGTYGSILGGVGGSMLGAAGSSGVAVNYNNHMGLGYAVRGYSDPVVVNDPISPMGTTTVSPQATGWQVFKAGFNDVSVSPGRQRLGGPHGLKFNWKGRKLNPGNYASNEIVAAATNRYSNPNAPYDVAFGRNINLGTSAKLGDAYVVNPQGVALMGAETAPAGMAAGDQLSRKEKRQERRKERKENRQAKKNYFGGWF